MKLHVRVLLWLTLWLAALAIVMAADELGLWQRPTQIVTIECTRTATHTQCRTDPVRVAK